MSDFVTFENFDTNLITVEKIGDKIRVLYTHPSGIRPLQILFINQDFCYRPENKNINFSFNSSEYIKKFKKLIYAIKTKLDFEIEIYDKFNINNIKLTFYVKN